MMSRTSYCFLYLSLLLLSLLVSSRRALGNTPFIPTAIDSNRGEGLWISEDGVSQDAYFAGVILIALTQGGQQYNRDTLCVDLFTDIYLNVTYNTQILQPAEVPGRNLDRVSWLVDNALMPTQGPIYSSLLPSSDWVTSPAQGAGIQLAIWDV